MLVVVTKYELDWAIKNNEPSILVMNRKIAKECEIKKVLTGLVWAVFLVAIVIALASYFVESKDHFSNVITVTSDGAARTIVGSGASVLRAGAKGVATSLASNRTALQTMVVSILIAMVSGIIAIYSIRQIQYSMEKDDEGSLILIKK
jgi:hypothetical protein